MLHKFEIANEIDWVELDAYPDRTIFQTKAWLHFVAEAQGAEPVILRVTCGSERVGYYTGLSVRKFGLKILGSPFPGWTTSYMGFNLSPETSRAEVASAFIRFAHRELGVAHLELMDRRLPLEDAEHHRWKHRVFRNFEIDLTLSEEDLFAQLKGACRTSIRKSQREGVTIEIANDPAFADDYYAQLTDVFNKQGLAPTYGIERVRLLMKHLLPTGNLLLLRARDPHGDCVATGIYPAFNDSMYFWGGASWRKYQILQPNEPLHWFAMCYWKERGKARCDMGGGGEYKRKYGGHEIAVPYIRSSRYPGLETARNLAQRLQALRQKSKT
jgi:hypothetical protein